MHAFFLKKKRKKENPTVCVNFNFCLSVSFKDYMLVRLECCCLWLYPEIWYFYTQSAYSKQDIPHLRSFSHLVICLLDLSRYGFRLCKCSKNVNVICLLTYEISVARKKLSVHRHHEISFCTSRKTRKHSFDENNNSFLESDNVLVNFQGSMKWWS